MSLTALDAAALRQVVTVFRDALVDHREAVNNLNVYPVPDGDTGTNMSLTLRSVVEELDGVDADTADAADMAVICKAIAHGSLMGARGNSGVIMSQILRGFSGVAAETDEVDGALFATALAAAAEGAYGAVGNPVEGTILTVVREASEAAVAAAETGADLVGVLDAARTEGGASLERTPTLLKVLADAGVVDAGGSGFLLFLDAALNVVDDRPLPEPDVQAPPEFEMEPAAEDGEKSIADLRYEVMFLLDAPDESIEGFKAAWAEVGDSIVVVGGDGIFNCHIHCDDIGAAIECGIDVGRPHKIRVTDLLEELDGLANASDHEEDWVKGELGIEPEVSGPPVPTAVVAVAVGAGVVSILKSMGVHAVVTGGQSMNPSTADLVAAVEAVPAPEVVILPNNKNIIPVAEQVDAQTSRTVKVVPTRGIAEGIASLMSYDPQATAEANAAGMAEVAEGVLAGEVTQAVRESTSEAGPIVEGDWLGIRHEGICAVQPTLAEAAIELLNVMITYDHELLTVIAGEDADDDTTARIEAWVEEHHEDVEVEVHEGGQPLYPYYFGLE
ncbi:MAG: DAK2 domain-containing protein [Acidimicrobiales bacterium]